ncbi:MAG: phosphorylcholine transferase LicD [Lachnospira sp.]
MNDCSKIELDEKKKIMLDMLQSFFAYCEKHSLKCFLAGGTLLGAVRHKGYIPWDDDVDLMMPLDDYNKLIKLALLEPIGEYYFLSSMESNKQHMWPMLKLIDKRTVLIEKDTVRKKLEEQQAKYYGVYLDVFPMYGMPINYNDRISHQKTINRIYSDYKKTTRIMTKRKSDSKLVFYFRRLVYDIVCIPYRLIGTKHYIRKMMECISRFPLKDSEYYGFSCGITKGTKDHFRTVLLNNILDLQFESLKCPAPSGYDEMLKNQYGDYMQLPPVEQRRYHPSDVFWRLE